MTYSVTKIDTAYGILEHPTGNIVFKTRDEREARVKCKGLNLGAGFDGFTPMFFTLDYPSPTES